MSKRKRAGLGRTPAGTGQPPAIEDTTATDDDSAVKEDMAHVSPDWLAGSPDIFASRPGKPAEGAEPPAEAGEPVAPISQATEPPAEGDAVATSAPPPQAPPPFVAAEPQPVAVPAPPPARPRRGGSSAALGVVLVVVGIFALAIVMFGIDLSTYGWPLFVIIPGLTLLVVGFLRGGAGASIPGGIVTMLGLVLAYQSSSGDWPSWAFAWALIAPGGVGLGMYLQALRDRDVSRLRRGRSLMFVGALIFLIGFVLFESILGISGLDYGAFGKAALPALLIVIGIILLVRSIQRSRRA
ncbi:hypothetical protein EPN29_13455 [bacterium]|nr:MAG: hypothetical protein EPN29_13455 [bacterium]